jgi:hypothetical protein
MWKRWVKPWAAGFDHGLAPLPGVFPLGKQSKLCDVGGSGSPEWG